MTKRRTKAQKANDQLHDMYMFKAGWKAFLGKELSRVRSLPVQEVLQALDAAVDGLVKAYEAGKPARLSIEVLEQLALDDLERMLAEADDELFRLTEDARRALREAVEDEKKRLNFE